jgi:hypothetical protein
MLTASELAPSMSQSERAHATWYTSAVAPEARNKQYTAERLCCVTIFGLASERGRYAVKQLCVERGSQLYHAE